MFLFTARLLIIFSSQMKEDDGRGRESIPVRWKRSEGEGKRTATRLFHSFPALFPQRRNTTLTVDAEQYCDSGQEQATPDRRKSRLACKFLVKAATSWTIRPLLLSSRWMGARAINDDCHSCPQRIDLSSHLCVVAAADAADESWQWGSRLPLTLQLILLV